MRSALLFAIMFGTSVLGAQAPSSGEAAPNSASGNPPSISAVQSGQTPAGADRELATRMRAYWDAWCSLNPSSAARFYTQDRDAVFFDVAPFQYTGWPEYELGVQGFLGQYRRAVGEVRDIRTHRNGNNAWTTAILSMTADRKQGGTDHLRFRWTAIWQKQRGEWVILHEHVSVPAQ